MPTAREKEVDELFKEITTKHPRVNTENFFTVYCYDLEPTHLVPAQIDRVRRTLRNALHEFLTLRQQSGMQFFKITTGGFRPTIVYKT